MVKLKYTSESTGEEKMIKVHDDVAAKIELYQNNGPELESSIYQFNGMIGKLHSKDEHNYLRMIVKAGVREYEVIEQSIVDTDFDEDNVLIVADYLKGCKTVEDVANAINTHGIEVEYLPLPIVGLYLEFQFRFSVPFQTALTMQTIKIGHGLLMRAGDNDPIVHLRREAVNRFIEMSEENGLMGLKQTMPINLVEMNLVRKV